MRFLSGDKALFADWLETAYNKLSELTDEVWVSVSASNREAIKKRLPEANILSDEAPYVGEGPLSAFYALSVKFDGRLDVLSLPVDSPEIVLSDLTDLLTTPNVFVRENFLIAHVTFSSDELSDFLASGERRVKKFFSGLGAEIVDVEVVNHNEK